MYLNFHPCASESMSEMEKMNWDFTFNFKVNMEATPAILDLASKTIALMADNNSVDLDLIKSLFLKGADKVHEKLHDGIVIEGKDEDE